VTRFTHLIAPPFRPDQPGRARLTGRQATGQVDTWIRSQTHRVKRLLTWLAGPASALAIFLAPVSILWVALPANGETLPLLLSETGLFRPGEAGITAPGVLTFSPQYPLWSDGATKRRWIYLPPGSSIDASRPDAWEFPPGTKLWKEFSVGRAVETRVVERLEDGTWRFAAYVWRQDGSDAELAPSGGIAALPVPGAPDSIYGVPSEPDCRACHEGGPVPVLGFSALQLSPDRDPGALHAQPPGTTDVDLRTLADRGLLRNLPAGLLNSPPRIDAPSADGRAALGYLHANCGHCHNDPRESGAGVPVDLLLAQYAGRPDSAGAVIDSLLGTTSRFRMTGQPTRNRAELVTLRMHSRNPNTQMPPLGTRIADAQALSLMERWLASELQSQNSSNKINSPAKEILP